MSCSQLLLIEFATYICCYVNLYIVKINLLDSYVSTCLHTSDWEQDGLCCSLCGVCVRLCSGLPRGHPDAQSGEWAAQQQEAPHWERLCGHCVQRLSGTIQLWDD